MGKNLIKSKKILISFLLLFIIPIAGFIADLNFQYIAHEMEDNWLQDFSYFIYIESLYVSVWTTTIQFIYFLVLMVVSLKVNNSKFIALSAFLIFFSCITGFLVYVRFIAAAAGV